MTTQVDNEEQLQDGEAQQALTQGEQADEAAAFAEAVTGEKVLDEQSTAGTGEEEEQQQAGADDDQQGEEQEGEPEGQPEGEQAAGTQVDDEPVIGNLKESELVAMLAKLPKIDEIGDMSTKEIQKLYGKIGELNRNLQELQKKGSGGTALNVAGLQFTKLKENFPELAEMLVEGLSEVQVNGGSGLTLEDVERLSNEKVAGVKTELQQEMQVSLLRIQHPDYSEVHKSDEFKVWKQTLPEDEQTKIEESWDAAYLSGVFNKFKDWRKERTQSSQQRKDRLKGALRPKTNAGTVRSGPLSEEEAFLAAGK
jgi:hypothetical protein